MALQIQSQEHQSHALAAVAVVALGLPLRVKLAEQAAVVLVVRSLSRVRLAQLIQVAVAVVAAQM